jgi:hypothetical protein
VGFSVAHLLESAATTFLVYLAVDPDWRSKQVGRALFEATDRTGAKRFQAVRRRAAGMVWEIDDPTESDEPGERAIRLRRRTFFEMLGGRVLATLYIQPPIDGRTEVPMQLMFRPATACALPAAADRFALVRAIYFEKYQPMNQISASTLDRLLASVVGCGADME